jgi:glycosyltransferase involved in cell wall biosynthesis
MAKIKASYIMGNYNKQSYIAESISSILQSTEPNIELVVVDDCSTDDSMDVLSHYAKIDKRVKLFRNDTNLGIAKTYNRATAESKGEIVLVAASDDVYDYDRAKWALKAFKKFDADIIYWPFYKSQEKTLGEQGMALVPFERKIVPTFDAERLKKVDGQFIGHGFSAYTRKVADTVKYREEYKHGIDHHFFLDAWKAGFKFQHIADDKQLAGQYRFYIKMVSNQFRDEIVKQDEALEAEYKGVAI